MKKRLLLRLVSLFVFVALLAGLNYISWLQRTSPFENPIPVFVIELKRQWMEYKKQWKEKHDGIPAQLPTPTSYPMLSENERKARLMELFRSNAGCRFPCWWGIVPGKTTWEEIHALLSPLTTSEISRYLSDDGGMFAYGYYYGPSSLLTMDFSGQDGMPVSSFLISDIPPEYLSNLRLSRIFQDYGMPEEIYMRSPHRLTGNFEGGCFGALEMFLYYPAQQFAVGYSYEPYLIDKPIRVCGLDQPASVDVFVWASGAYQDFQKVAGGASWFPSSPIHTIQEDSDWSTELLFQTFQSETGGDACIEAPPFDWSYIGRNPGYYVSCTPSPP